MSPGAPLPRIGIAHFTTIGVEPLAYAAMAARIGYRAIGLRLYPAFPGAPFYQIPTGSALMKSLRSLLKDGGISVFDIEFVVVDDAFDPAKLKPVLETAAELGAVATAVICGLGVQGYVAAIDAVAAMAAGSLR